MFLDPKSYQLTLEQEFSLAVQKSALARLARADLEESYCELLRLFLIKENIIKACIAKSLDASS